MGITQITNNKRNPSPQGVQSKWLRCALGITYTLRKGGLQNPGHAPGSLTSTISLKQVNKVKSHALSDKLTRGWKHWPDLLFLTIYPPWHHSIFI